MTFSRAAKYLKNEPTKLNRLLLCTDLDRTLIPNGSEPESAQAREKFALLTSQTAVNLVYVTGRHQQLVKQAIRQYDLPQPDYVIADVGSSIYQIVQSDWNYQQDWQQLIANDWSGMQAGQLQKLFVNIGNIQLQEQTKQNTHKLSYYVSLKQDHQQIITMMADVLKRNSLKANLVWSIDEQKNLGLLDVLPASAGKQQAITFLMQKLGYDTKETVFAGDSGNDIDVLCSPINSVLVANANQQVRALAVSRAQANHQQQSLYLAQGGFMQMNGNYSAGILEGVVHYIPQAENWLKTG